MRHGSVRPPMTTDQLYFAIGLPILINSLLMVLLFGLLAGQLHAVIRTLDERLDRLNQRFDDTRELWKSELIRLEDRLVPLRPKE
jgi:hypothetical protein